MINIAAAPDWVLGAPRPERGQRDREASTGTKWSQSDPERVRSALPFVDADEYETWLHVGMALHEASGGSDEGFELWDEWSQRSDKYDSDAMTEKWESFSPGGGITLGTLFELAKQAGWVPLHRNGRSEEERTSEEEIEDGQRDRSHDGLALELGDRWAGKARYVAAWGTWLFFDGLRWKEDEQLHHKTLTRAFLRGEAARLLEDSERLAAEKEARGDGAAAERIRASATASAKALRGAQTVAQVSDLARSNRAQAATVAQWDADPHLIGTPSGTLDLRTGTLRDARPEDHITKTTAVAPAPEGTPAPIWEKFLHHVTGGDQALVTYLQRFAGYCLTGSVEEHVFAFAHGTGGNGKGVFSITLRGIWHDYAVVIPTEMLMAQRADRHPTELARLRGVRLAIGSETEQGTRWAEAQIKRLTGGDPIAARKMRQDFFEFEPTHKLFVIGNKKPELRGVDDAMRRRMNFVPFTVTISEAERDTRLPEKLRAEWPAILRWAIQGALLWRRDGLKAPAVVRAATADYLEAEDAVSLWLEEATTADPGEWESTGALFRSWKEWAERAGEFVGSQKRLSQALQDHGLTAHRMASARGFYGRKLPARQEGGRWPE